MMCAATAKYLPCLLPILTALTITAAADPTATSPVVQPAAPKFLIGVWYQPASSFQKWKDRGINTLIGYEGEGGGVSRDAWMKAAREAGLYYIVKPIPQDPAQMKSDAADPNLLAWEQPDEPDGGGNVPPDQIIANYKAWKAIAADKPVLLNFDGWKTQWRPPADYVEYCKGGDWLAFDYYIINRGEGPDNIKRIGERLDKLKEWSGGAAARKKLLVFIECSDQNLKAQDWAQNNDATGKPPAPRMRCPTPDEMKQEVNIAIQHGASGIIYFPDRIGKGWENFDSVPPDVESAMKELNAKLAGAPRASVTIPPPKITPGTPASGDDPYDGTEITIDGKTYILKRKN
jgi:hypothetical protein